MEDMTYISIGIVPCLGCFFQQSARMRDLIICLMIKGGYEAVNEDGDSKRMISHPEGAV